MAYNFQNFKNSTKETEEWLKKEFAGIRTGRATPAILDGIKVESYGSMMPINQLANISVEDARMMRINPWDASVTKSIEKAILVSDLGLSVVVDDKGLRVTFPDLTSERRADFVKIAKQKLEDAKITVRGEREKVIKDLEKQEKDGSLSKDDNFRAKNELQKMIDESNKNLEEIFTKKEKEIIE
ncbi:MAG TPA: ribosome recycling factor [Candidatus Paceibacterota bacterium]